MQKPMPWPLARQMSNQFLWHPLRLIFFSPKLVHFRKITFDQTKIKCWSAVATLRAEQGPYEPSKGFVSKSGERQRVRESQREPEEARDRNKNTKSRKRVLYCDVRVVSHSCNVFPFFYFLIPFPDISQVEAHRWWHIGVLVGFFPLWYFLDPVPVPLYYSPPPDIWEEQAEALV